MNPYRWRFPACVWTICVGVLLFSPQWATARQAISGVSLAVQIPTTPAGEQLTGWLQAFNSGNRETMKAFQGGHFDAALLGDAGHRLNMDMDLRERTGGFDLMRIESSVPLKITALLKERNSEQWARIVLDVSEDEAHRITGIGLRPTPAPAVTSPQDRPSNGKMLEAVDAKVRELCQKDQFSGAVLVTKDGRSIFEKACGMADQDRKLPNRLDTKFNLGSLNKMFTAVAVAQLAQQGKLKFSDTISKYLRDYPNIDVAAQVTIDELLTHTSGLGGDIFGAEFTRKQNTLKQLSDYVPLFASEPLLFKPGTSWAYSNAGFVVLGVIIEKVSGENYYDYVRRHIFELAGMSQTDSYWKTDDVSNLAVGYTRPPDADNNQPRTRNDEFLPLRGTSAGGGYSTVGDLAKFASALLSHKLLNEEMTRMVTMGKVATPRGSKYAYGFDDRLQNGNRIIGHNGGSPGANAQLDIYVQSGSVVVALSNYDPHVAEQIADHVAANMP
jgi:CubicO group peptidase (beta-lactamase class C family)